MDDDVVSDLTRRYWSLAVTACEWRAYGVEPPEAMAARAFASLNPGKVADLRHLFQAIDTSVAQAYRKSVEGRSTMDALRDLATVRRDIPRPAALIALSALHEGDRRILQHAYWDDLDRVEIANVLGIDLERATQRLDTASGRLAARLAKRGVPVDDIGSVLRELKPGVHHRRP